MTITVVNRVGSWMAAIAVSAVLAIASVRAEDGVWTNSVGNGGYWTETNRWLNGIVANGVGATADFGYISAPISMTITVNTNITLGTWLIGGYLDGNNQKYAFGCTGTNVVTMDNGENQAVIAGTHITKINKEAYINVPLVLNSDVMLTVTNPAAAGNPALYVGRNISETAAPRSVTIKTPAGSGISLLGSNTFSGPVVLQSGTLQLGGVDSIAPSSSPYYTTIGATRPHAGYASSALGQNAVVAVTNSSSTLNMHNAIAGAGKTLLLAGAGANNNGVLVNNGNLSPVFTGQWVSAISLKANASVGGGGNLIISGDISDDSKGFQLTKVGSGTLFLRGANSYAGGTLLSAGMLNAASLSALGSGSLIFNNGTFQFGGSFDLSALPISNINSKVVNLDTLGYNITLANALSSFNNGLSKVGSGTLTLSGANSFTGGSTVNQGVLALDYTSQNNSKLATAQNLTLNNGTLKIIGNTGGFTQSVNGLTINAGASAIINQSGNTTLSLAGLTRNTGGVLDVVDQGGGVRTTTANANNILSALATVEGTDWAKNDANSIVAFSAYNTDSFNANDNTDVTQSQSTSALTINSLRFNTAIPVSLTLGSTLTLTTGGILLTDNLGNNAVEITGGTLAGASGKDLVVFQNNTHAALTISSAIANNGAATALTKAGPGLLVVTNAQSTFTGNVYVHGGTLAVYSPFDLGSTNIAKTVYINNGSTLQMIGTWTNGTSSVARGINVGPDGGVLCIPNASDTITLTTGTIAYNYGATLRKIGSGTVKISSQASWTTAGYPSIFSAEEGVVDLAGNSMASLVPVGGTVVLKNGVVIMNGHQLLQAGSGNALSIVAQGGVLDLQATANLSQANLLQGDGTLVVTNRVTGAQTFNLNATQNDFTGVLDLEFANGANGFNFSAGMPNGELRLGSAVVANQISTFALPGQTEIRFGALSGRGRLNMGTLPVVIGDARDEATTFNGLIAGNGTLFKSGSGTWALSGTNTYTRGTVIREGVLLVNNTTGSATGPGPVLIQAGATLGGNGTIGGSVTNLAEGVLSPGEGGAGLLTINGNLVLSAGSDCQFDVGQTTGDKTVVGNSLLIDGACAIHVERVQEDPIVGFRIWTLFTYGGSMTGFDHLSLLLNMPGFKGELINNTVNKSIDIKIAKMGTLIRIM